MTVLSKYLSTEKLFKSFFVGVVVVVVDVVVVFVIAAVVFVAVVVIIVAAAVFIVDETDAKTCSQDAFHEGSVKMFDKCFDKLHFLARVFEDGARVGNVEAQNIRRHHHR